MTTALVNPVEASPLGKNSSYINTYAPELLFPIPRIIKRQEINVPLCLPFKGFDTWNAYELSWLNSKGKPIVAMAQIDIPCESDNIIESKSFKLYLNSLNNTKFESFEQVKQLLETDLSQAVGYPLTVQLQKLDELTGKAIESFHAESIDDLDIECTNYVVSPIFLRTLNGPLIDETLCSNLLKSNCLVTGQPDWGSIRISYTGKPIDRVGLLKYIVSFRNHNEFHEQCVERIFMDVMTYCTPTTLTVEARYTRRGGLDINPLRSTKITDSTNIRMARQ